MLQPNGGTNTLAKNGLNANFPSRVRKMCSTINMNEFVKAKGNIGNFIQDLEQISSKNVSSTELCMM